MCTATWLTFEKGYELFFNRDEARTRMPAEPARIQELEGCRALAPTDGDAGGTWIGVNELGLSVALLNASDAYGRSEGFQSRGRLVRELLASGGTEDALERLARAELTRFRGFRVLFLEPGATRPEVRAWDGSLLHEETPRLPLASSSVGSVEAHAVRALALGELTTAAGGEPPALGERALDRALLEAFHGSHLPERGAFSPCMHRPDARTVSVSHVVVSEADVSFRYAPGPLCKAAFGDPLSLPRQIASPRMSLPRGTERGERSPR